MKIEFNREQIKGSFLNFWETDAMVIGFTERDFCLEALADRFPTVSRKAELKQVHGDTILDAAETAVDIPNEDEPAEPAVRGDGIILENPRTLAVIKTADCTPLFAWNRGQNTGAVVHVGRRGLHLGIEKKLAQMLAKFPGGLEEFYFFTGPAIEQQCYEVGPELYETFSGKSYRQEIFSPLPTGGQNSGGHKFLMDVRKGVHLSLLEEGVLLEHTGDSGLCTSCEKERLPSYRRDKDHVEDARLRIYNFMFFKPRV